MWEELLTDDAAGDTIALDRHRARYGHADDARTGSLHPGDFWSIGVRPATPDTVLPDRLLRTPQPPDGPRMWACPLAVIEWKGGQLYPLDDCRVPFPPLTNLPTSTPTTTSTGGCCTVSVEPKQAAELQKIIEKVTAGREIHDPSTRVTVCLRPGRYFLSGPIKLGPGQGELHLEGCGEGAVLAAKPGSENKFPQGLIELYQADAVKITGITFLPPLAGNTGDDLAKLYVSDAIDPTIAAIVADRAVAIGIRPVSCADLSVADCVFDFGDQAPSGASDLAANDAATGVAITHLRGTEFAIGIFTGGICERMSVTDCLFTYTDVGKSGTGTRIRVGVLSTPALLRDPKIKGKSGKSATSVLDGALIDTILRANTFISLTVAVAVMGAPGGLRATDNTVRDCYGGIWLAASDTLMHMDLIGAYQATGITADAMAGINETVSSTWLDPALMFLVAHGWTYPLPDAAVDAAAANQSGTPVAAADWTKTFTARVTGGDYPPAVNSMAAGAVPSPPLPSLAAKDQAAVDPADSGNEVWFGRFAGSRAELVADGGPAQQAIRDAALTVETIAAGLYAPAQPVGTVTILIHGNIVDCTQPTQNFAIGDGNTGTGVTGPALLVVNISAATGVYTHSSDVAGAGTVIVDANEFSAQPSGPVAVVMLMSTVTVTGNVIRRLIRDENDSLSVLGVGGGAAITGNVLYGPATLPSRPFVAPLDSWTPFNTVN